MYPTVSSAGDVVNDLERAGCLKVLDASLFERSVVHKKRMYRTKSQQRSSGVMGTVGVMDTRRKEGLKRTCSMCNVELSFEAGKIIHK